MEAPKCRLCGERHAIGECPKFKTERKPLVIPPRKTSTPVGDGVALTATAHPPGLIDKMADAIKTGKLQTKPKFDRNAYQREYMRKRRAKRFT